MSGAALAAQDSVGTQRCLGVKSKINKTAKEKLSLSFSCWASAIKRQNKLRRQTSKSTENYIPPSPGQTRRRLSVTPSPPVCLSVCLLLLTQPGDLGSNLSGACPGISLSTSSITVQHCRGNGQKLSLGQSLLSLSPRAWSGSRRGEGPPDPPGVGVWGGRIRFAFPGTSLHLEVWA